MVVPRCCALAEAAMPAVSAPESAGTVKPYKMSSEATNHPGAVLVKPIVQHNAGRRDHHDRDGAVPT